jgi:hypothetical protein
MSWDVAARNLVDYRRFGETLPSSSGGDANRVNKQIKTKCGKSNMDSGRGKSCDIAELLFLFTLIPEDGTNTFLRNVGKVLRDYTESYARR